MKCVKEKRQKVIIDSDMGWDDVLAINYLLKHPNIEIIGITVTGCGETDLRWGTIIAQNILGLAKQNQAKVSVGTSTPMKFNHMFPQSFKDNMNGIVGLIGSLNPKDVAEVDPRPAWTFIADTLNETEDPIDILSIGGFTNLAKMLKLHPQACVEKIRSIHAMAGAVYVDGNIYNLSDSNPSWDQGLIYTSNHYAEWNIFIDPLAAKIVFESQLPLTLVPLDACSYVLFREYYAKRIKANDPIAALSREMIERKLNESSEGHPLPVFDPLSALIMAGGIEINQSHLEYLDVNLTETSKDNHCGDTFVTNSGSRKIEIVQGVSEFAFVENYSKIMNRAF